MENGNYAPDAPFRSGVTGKYKLLIKSVKSSFSNYEYELVDAEGKEYKTRSTLHFAVGQMLRCMVTFRVVKARFVVEETLICKHQDLATPLPALNIEKKTPAAKHVDKARDNKTSTIHKQAQTPKAAPKNKKSNKSPLNKGSVRLGSPRRIRASKVYNLRVVEAERINNNYSLLMEDADGYRYPMDSDRPHPIGSVLPCDVSVSLSSMGELRVIVKSIHKHVDKVSRSKPFRTDSKGSNWQPNLPVGVRFHLIYTPMGNKR